MSDKKSDELVGKLMEATKDDFPALLFFCVGSESGFALMKAKEKRDHARLMAQITESLVENDDLYSMMKEIMSKANELKGVN